VDRRSIPIHLAVLILVASLSACAFDRTQVNEQYLGMDTSSIEVGKTTWREVIRELGPPSPTVSTENPLEYVSLRHLKYSSTDRRSTSFLFGYLLIMNFDWSDQQPVEELIVEFDDNGVVSGVWRTYNDTIRPPLQGEGSREEQVTYDHSGGDGQ